MFKKGTLPYSIFKNKCPKCNEGDFFKDSNPFHLRNTMKMHINCSHCGFKYEIEPSFFYGAMYISYALTVALSIITFIILYQFDLSFMQIFIGIILALFIAAPLTLRFSRLIYSNVFVSYDPTYKNEEGLIACQKDSIDN